MKTYQSEMFNDLVFKLTELFVTLPPPPPSVQSYRPAFANHRTSTATARAGGGGSGRRAMPTVTMQNIMDYNNGCILASCRVRTIEGGEKQMGELRRGDVLANGARVKCVVLSRYQGLLVKPSSGLDGSSSSYDAITQLVITPYHPVRVASGASRWTFPIDLVDKTIVEVSSPVLVCNLVLESVHTVNVGGFECVTLAHGFEDDPVVKHDYYGTRRVLDDLERLDGWSSVDGRIVLDRFRVRRDKRSGMVESTCDHVVCHRQIDLTSSV